MKKPALKKPAAPTSRLVKLALAIGAGLAGLAALIGNYEKVCKFVDTRLSTNICFLSAPELVITPFATNGLPTSGNGHGLKTNPPAYKDSIAFQGGATLVTSLSSSAQDDTVITVSGIALKLVAYSDEEITSLNYDFGLSNLVGKGISAALFYRVTLDGNNVRVVEVSSANGVAKSVEVQASDLLDKNKQVNLRGKGESQIINLQLIPRKNGLYTIELHVSWSSKGRMHSTQSQRIYLYRREPQVEQR